MTTAKLLEEMAKDAFGATFQTALDDLYDRSIPRDYAMPEREYNEAMEALPNVLSQEKQLLVQEFEEKARWVRKHNGGYGFLAGLYCGFLQYFTEHRDLDGGFTQYVTEEISKMPNAKRHRENYTRLNRMSTIELALVEGETEETAEHIISMEFAWSQRNHSASVYGFYTGYRAALEIVDLIVPNENCKAKMIGKLLSMEHRLGFTQSYAERERETA